nr:zinc finger, CCHC-type [Tanacetum cinerariifolium]
MLTACYLLNRVPNKNNKTTPYELWYKKRPNLSYLRVWGCRAVVRLPEPKKKTLGENGIDCIFIGYDEHSKAYRFYVIKPNDFIFVNSVIKSRDEIFDKNRFSSMPRPNDIIFSSNGTQAGDLLVEESRDEIASQYSYCYSIEEDPKTFDEAMKSRDTKEGIDYFDTYAPVARISTIRLLIALAATHNLVIHQMDVKITFLNGDLEEEIYMKQPKEFVMPGIKLMPHMGKPINQLEYSRAIGCLMYAMKSTRSDIAYAIEKLSRFTSNPSYYDASWITNSEDHTSTTCWVFLLGGGAISWASKKQTCITDLTKESEFVALTAAGKEAEWLRNLIYEIPLWPKPISPIFMHCDSAATLAKAYSQIYNGKSRHLGVRHSMVREFITNGVISVDFVRSQHNLSDHLTKGLARDLVHKSTIRMGLKSI